MLITIKEYAEQHGVSASAVHRKAVRGGYKTAQKIGRDWLIDSDEEYTDLRVKNGKWIGYWDKRRAASARRFHQNDVWEPLPEYWDCWYANGLYYPIRWTDIEDMAVYRGSSVDALLGELKLIDNATDALRES